MTYSFRQVSGVPGRILNVEYVLLQLTTQRAFTFYKLRFSQFIRLLVLIVLNYKRKWKSIASTSTP